MEPRTAIVNIDIHQYEEAKTYLTFIPYRIIGKAEIKQNGLVHEVMQISTNKYREVWNILLSKGIKLY